MNTISYTYARNHLAETIDKTIDDHAPIKITLGKDKRAVLMSEEEYDSMVETLYLLSSPKNAQRLFESIAEINEMIKQSQCPK